MIKLPNICSNRNKRVFEKLQNDQLKLETVSYYANGHGICSFCMALAASHSKHVQKGWHINSKPNQFYIVIPNSCDFLKKFIKSCSWCKVWCALPLLNGCDCIYVSLLSHRLQSYHKTELIMPRGFSTSKHMWSYLCF